MTGERKNIGRLGEEEACKYLLRKGYIILGRNFNCKSGEIDIIAESVEGTICFVEVKTRRSRKYGVAAEAVTFEKRKHLQRSIEFYLLSNGRYKKRQIRADVLEVYLNGQSGSGDFNIRTMEINHIQNIGLLD